MKIFDPELTTIKKEEPITEDLLTLMVDAYEKELVFINRMHETTDLGAELSILNYFKDTLKIDSVKDNTLQALNNLFSAEYIDSSSVDIATEKILENLASGAKQFGKAILKVIADFIAWIRAFCKKETVRMKIVMRNIRKKVTQYMSKKENVEKIDKDMKESTSFDWSLLNYMAKKEIVYYLETVEFMFDKINKLSPEELVKSSTLDDLLKPIALINNTDNRMKNLKAAQSGDTSILFDPKITNVYDAGYENAKDVADSTDRFINTINNINRKLFSFSDRLTELNKKMSTDPSLMNSANDVINLIMYVKYIISLNTALKTSLTTIANAMITVVETKTV